VLKSGLTQCDCAQSVGDQLADMEALKAAASRAAAEAANKLAALQREYDLVVTERDALRSEVASLRAQVCGNAAGCQPTRLGLVQVGMIIRQ
jgi:hypothetical protein